MYECAAYHFTAGIGTSTSLMRCTVPSGRGTSPYTMYGDLSSRYQVARSLLSDSRCSSTFHALMVLPSTFTSTLPTTVNLRCSAFVMPGPQIGTEITRPALKPTAAGTRSEADATNPIRSIV